jgi:hypothetical protein
MSGKACSSSRMMSAMLAEAVVRVDEPWEVLIGCWSGWGKLSRTLLLIVGGCAKLIFDLISYHYVIYAYMIIYGWHTLGGLGGIPYMVEVNDIEGLYQRVRDISGITTYEWAWRDGIMSTDMWLTVGRLGDHLDTRRRTQQQTTTRVMATVPHHTRENGCRQCSTLFPGAGVP